MEWSDRNKYMMAFSNGIEHWDYYTMKSKGKIPSNGIDIRYWVLLSCP